MATEGRLAMASYLRVFVVAALTPVLTLFLFGIYLQPLTGDLARIGSLPERDFGWQAAQPDFDILASPGAAPSVIVLGDSFSVPNTWQSQTSRISGFEFLTFDWEGFRQSSCLAPWLRSLKGTYPSVEYVILETVERELLVHFHSRSGCLRDRPLDPVGARPVRTSPYRRFDWSDVMPDPHYAIRAGLTPWISFDQTTRRGDAVIAPMIRSDLFSSRRSDKLVYFAKDDEKSKWAPAEISRVAREIQDLGRVANEEGIRLVFMIIPDKSTVYARFLREPRFPAQARDPWSALDDAGVVQVQLKALLDGVVESRPDLYMPDDSHLSIAGFLLVGQAVADRVAQWNAAALQAAPASPRAIPPESARPTTDKQRLPRMHVPQDRAIAPIVH